MALESLTRAEDFKRLLRAGVSARAGGVAISALPGTGGSSRLGLAVKASKAVDRNRVKRRLRAASREALQERDRPVDLLVRADVSAKSTSFQELVDGLKLAARL